MKLELFHAIASPGSARVRKFVDANGILHLMRYRNVFYPEVLADLQTHGADETQVPALWDGEQLHVGADAVIRILEVTVSQQGTRRP